MLWGSFEVKWKCIQKEWTLKCPCQCFAAYLSQAKALERHMLPSRGSLYFYSSLYCSRAMKSIKVLLFVAPPLLTKQYLPCHLGYCAYLVCCYIHHLTPFVFEPTVLQWVELALIRSGTALRTSLINRYCYFSCLESIFKQINYFSFSNI